MANNIQGIWGAIGYFNVITSIEEKKGGRSYRREEILDFLECLNDCGLQDAGYNGSIYTWCDNRDPPTTIWKRLDRLVYNSSCKVISKILNNRISSLLPKIISKNQSGFIGGRGISENILLAQEIINDIKNPARGGNVVLKLDMAKACDRVSWEFLCQALKRFGFSEWWTHLMYNFISSNCKKPLEMMLKTLKVYEEVSGQLLNKEKSCFAVANNSKAATINKLKNITGMKHQLFPIRYLGCPLITGKKKISHNSVMVSKIIDKIRGWHTKFLSTSGRAILIRHVLLAMPIHLFAATTPPKGTIELIEKYIIRFFWTRQDTRGKYHWASWKNLCYPYEEGGTNFRNLEDMCHAFQTKQWWNLRITTSLWKNFIKDKYFNNMHPIKAQWSRGQPQSWKVLCNIKEEVDKNIKWIIGKGEVDFWYDNWTNI
ncbi:uncharacterized protein LOC125855975 [Solanum stenotomum]|uniref:uncharacterized protein LOC125855975 n=1 Tax=Solanum stenotomum TaxID=172797 RepID=UPI0020D1ED29|nr:uncharacterized protein LOC125855975 [Solanum stenotomum]